MKAPDKIYLQTCGDCPGFECESCQFQDLAEVTWCEDRIYEKDVEYIRKDALLEWAKEKKERLGKMFDSMPATAIGAKLDACKEFIDKIESL